MSIAIVVLFITGCGFSHKSCEPLLDLPNRGTSSDAKCQNLPYTVKAGISISFWIPLVPSQCSASSISRRIVSLPTIPVLKSYILLPRQGLKRAEPNKLWSEDLIDRRKILHPFRGQAGPMPTLTNFDQNIQAPTFKAPDVRISGHVRFFTMMLRIFWGPTDNPIASAT